MKPDDEVLFAVVRTKHMNVALRKSRLAKTFRYSFRRAGYVAHRICGVDLDQLFENVAGKLFSGIVDLGVGVESDEDGCAQDYQQAIQLFPSASANVQVIRSD